MKRISLVTLAALVLVMIVPLLASAQAITYDSGFQVQNLDDAVAAQITIYFYNQDGSVAATVPDTIAAGGSKTYYPLSQVSEGFSGSVVIESTTDIRAITNVLGNGLDFGASYGGFSAGATTVYAPLLMYANSGFSTWFNVQNAGTVATDVSIEYSDGLTASCLALEPGAACTVDQSTEGHAAKWVGSAVITAAEPVAVTVIEVGPTTLFAYTGFTAGSIDVAMPLINANNAGYITGVQLQNMGNTATSVTVSYTPSLAGTACSETLTIQPQQSSTFALAAFTAGGVCGAQKFIGSASISANSTNQNLVAIVNQLNVAANKGAAYEGFDPAAATNSVVMPLIMDRNSNYWTGFSIVNVGTAATTVNCTFTGTTYTVSDTIGPGEALTALQNGMIAAGYVGSGTCMASGTGTIVGIVNELNSVLTGDAFLVYDGFNK